MLRIKEAVVVEGKYDKIKLKGIIDAPILKQTVLEFLRIKKSKI